MKQLLLILILSCSFSSFGYEKMKITDYVVSEPVKDAKVAADKSLIRFTVSRKMKSYKGKKIVYAMDGGKNQTVLLTKATFDITVKPGNHKFQLEFSGGYYEITTNTLVFKGGYRTGIHLKFRRIVVEIAEPQEDYPKTDKPVIYLYPETEQAVNVQIEPVGELLFTYPEYQREWNITAAADGTIIQNGKTYPYLFWEAQTSAGQIAFDNNEGFVVERDEVITFLEEKLTAIGLTDKEQTDFITYWGPRLAANESTFIQFSWGTAANKFGKLNVSPQPHNVNRLYIAWSPFEAASTFSPKPQELPVFDRSGFNVLEWGGTEIPITSFTFTR